MNQASTAATQAANAPHGVSAERIFRKAVLSRYVEEKLLKLFAEGKLSGTLHTCIGQELTGAVLTEFLRPQDAIFSNHRGHGHFISFVGNLTGLMAELMGRESGVCRGFGGSQHLCERGFFTNGIQGGIVPVATGIALAKKLDRSDAISVVFIGDGTLGEGAIYEAFNIASIWDLPLLVVLEDNGIAQSTPQRQTLGGSIRERAAGFGLEYFAGDTWDWSKLAESASSAVARVRAGRGPALLHVRTFRLRAHSKGDDTRPRGEIEPYEARDPVSQFLRDPQNAAVVAELEAEVDRAARLAESSAPSIYAIPAPATAASTDWHPVKLPKEKGFRLLNRCLHNAMAACDRVVLLGEDVESPYGGAFKVSSGLSDAFPGRVLNTPISEAGIVGVGNGLALMQWRPVIEIMFGDFVGLAFDQLANHAAKFERMYGGKVRPNLIVRTPMGGRRGYGPTHSQTLDRHLLGIPGLRVLALNCLVDPAAVYDPLFATDCGPTLVIENKLDYGGAMFECPAGFEIVHSDGANLHAWLRPCANEVDVTLVGYGGMAGILAQAAEWLFEAHDVVAQVICPTQIYPFDIATAAPLIHRGRALIVAEEGQAFASFGAEVCAQLAEVTPKYSGRLRRIGPPPDVIPSSAAMEKAMLPSVEMVVRGAVEACA